MNEDISPDVVIMGTACLLPESMAKQLRVKKNTLAVWRVKRKGPKFIKVGSNIFYPIRSARKWIENQ